MGTGDESKPQTVDEWGCVWSRTEVRNMGQVTGHPLLEWSALDRYTWPDADDPVLYEGMEQQLQDADQKFVMTRIFMLLFERMCSLRGFSNALVDLALEDPRIEALADRIVEFDLTIINNISRRFPGQIHALYFTDDWGTERSTLISPRLWQDFFQARYQCLFDAIHEAGWFVWMHSCGQISAIVDLLIKTGVDVLNLQQPRVLDLRAFGQRFAGRVCFESLCDIQATLPFLGKDQIEEEARLLVQHWGTPQGGFILGNYGDSEAIGVPMIKKRWMLDAFLAADRRSDHDR